MVLSKRIAHQLVEQLSRVVEQSINIMDTSGIIISSTDKSRVGTIHGGAKRILTENLKDLLIVNDDEYEGAKNGINLPVLLDDKIVGVIGITGRSDEVARYGQIIKKMAEILLLESRLSEQKVIEQKARDRFFDEWMFGRMDVKSPEEFSRRAAALNIAPDKICRVAIFCVYSKSDTPLSEQELTEISRCARTRLVDSGNAEMFRTSTQFICLFKERRTERILELMRELCSRIESSFACEVYVGIDSASACPHIKDAYDHAEHAMHTGRSTGDKFTVYNELDIRQFISFVPDKTKNAYLERFFSGQSQEEIDTWIAFLKTYYACDGSIQASSQQLNMHKNTVQYKLARLKSITGIDPRKLSTAYAYNLAIAFHSHVKSKGDVM